MLKELRRLCAPSHDKISIEVAILQAQHKMLLGEKNALQLELDQANQKWKKFQNDKLAFLINGPQELRTSLNAILGFSELLQRTVVDDVRRREFSQHISQRGHDLLYAVNNIIEFSKIGSGQIELIKVNVDLYYLFEDIHTEQCSSMRHGKVELILKPDLDNKVAFTRRYIMADPVRLRHVLISLLRNAIQFANGSTIELGYKDEPDKSHLLFYVSDSGMGIQRDYRELIFKAFEKIPGSVPSAQGGIGLGLTVCKGLVECWGGEMWIDSILGRGSVFFFTIPYE